MPQIKIASITHRVLGPFSLYPVCIFTHCSENIGTDIISVDPFFTRNPDGVSRDLFPQLGFLSCRVPLYTVDRLDISFVLIAANLYGNDFCNSLDPQVKWTMCLMPKVVLASQLSLWYHLKTRPP